jgi:hypothetical protein
LKLCGPPSHGGNVALLTAFDAVRDRRPGEHAGDRDLLDATVGNDHDLDRRGALLALVALARRA